VAGVFLAFQPDPLSRTVLAFNPHTGFVVDSEPGCRESQLGRQIRPKKRQVKNLESKIQNCGALTGTPFRPARNVIPHPSQTLAFIFLLMAGRVLSTT
jgi:hypothetical protein